MMRRRAAVLALLVLAGCSKPAGQTDSHAADSTAIPAATSTVEITGGWARATPAGATAGAAYATLASATGDRLLAVRVGADVAATAELHEVVAAENGQMTMQKVDGVDLAPGVPLKLEPGSNHLMLIGLVKPLVNGDSLALTLTFQNAGDVELRIPVRDE